MKGLIYMPVKNFFRRLHLFLKFQKADKNIILLVSQSGEETMRFLERKN